MESTETERDGGMARLVTAVAVAALALTLLAPFALGRAATLGVALGGFLAVSNLWAIGAIVRAVLHGAGASWGAFAAVKLLVLLFVVWLVLGHGWAETIPLVFGYAALPLGLVTAQLWRGAPSRQKA